MKLRLVVPGGGALGEPASGGFRYDEALAAALRAQGHDARVVAAPEPGAVHLFDGLGATAWAPRLREVPGLKVALLHQPVAALSEEGARTAGAPLADAEAALLAGCDAVQFVSARAQWSARAVHQALPARSWVAPPGVDHFTPVPPARERRLVGNGHLWDGKGVLEALELVAALPGAWHLDWLGALDVDAEYTARVLARRQALGLEERVTFHGRVSQRAVAEHLARASACLATSRYESWGLGLAEALRAGVPVVGATPAGVLEFTGGLGARGGARGSLLAAAEPHAAHQRGVDVDGAELRLTAALTAGSPAIDGAELRLPAALAAGSTVIDGAELRLTAPATDGAAASAGRSARRAPLLSSVSVVEPGSTDTSLRAWLTHCLDDDALGRALREEARAAGALLPTWAECAATTARHLEALCAR